MANTSSGQHHLTYAYDDGFSTGAPPPDSPTSTVDVPRDADPEYQCNSPRKPSRLTDLRASLRVFTESFLRTETAEMETIKSREASRIESERRRAETESAIAQMLAKNQLQIAEFLAKKGRNRKRKRVQRDDSSAADRQGLLMLWLLQSNLDI